MSLKVKIPVWINNGPKDSEYTMYKMKANVASIKKDIYTNNLMESINEIDETLDYLYRYDAVKMTQGLNPMNQIISGFEFPSLELAFTHEEDIETDEYMDDVVNEAIDLYEGLHSMCREEWRRIEDGLTCNYIPNKPYFLNDGFVFIKTPDNKMHIYHFTKPNKYFTNNWKKFNMNLISTSQWTDEDFFKKVEEVVSRDSSKIIIKINCKTETILENNALAVINQKIFSMLHRDYSF